MLEALFILGGGTLVAGIVGALTGLEAGADAAETGVVNYGKNVEAKTRSVVTQEGDRRVKEVRIDTNKKWDKAVSTLQEQHARETEELVETHVAQITQSTKEAAQYGFQVGQQQLVAAGWRPPEDDPEYNPE